MKKAVYFSVWIDRHQAPGYAQIGSQYSSVLPANPSPNYWIVRLENTQTDLFANYCNAVQGCSGNSQDKDIIQDFLTETLL
jgi:hypothetical protein